jgi:signal recognition particle receptor subunit beta
MSEAEDSEFKIVFTGPMGAGKTTAISAISEIDPVSTEVENTDLISHSKLSTTVGFDFGRITLADGHLVRLYGTPGQPRFRFMWDILGRGAAGVIVLLDAKQPGALVQMDLFVDAFLPVVPHGALVIGVGRTEEDGALSSDAFASRLDARGIMVPVLSIDARKRSDVLVLVQTLVSILDAHLSSKVLA